jgi:hypothetical protein
MANAKGTGMVVTFTGLPIIAAIAGIGANLALMLPIFM